MRLLSVLLLALVVSASAQAATGRVLKVLPHLLDLQGRHALSPSLYDRDAYQAYLREHPEQQSGVRFDVLWKAAGTGSRPLKMKVEVRGIARGDLPEKLVLEKIVKPSWWRRWSDLAVQGSEFQSLSQITAWRVSIWDNNELLAEQKSFLW